MYTASGFVEGIGGAYSGSSFAVQAILASLLSCAISNSLELVVLVFDIFSNYRSLYFWSLLVTAGLGIIPESVALIVKYFDLGPISATVTLSTAGWCIMVTGHSLVLYSRLHCIVYKRALLRFVLGMIITDAIIFQIPQVIVSYGAVYANKSTFTRMFNTWEKVQITAFFVQEFLISSIFIVQTLRLLHLYPHRSQHKTKIMYQLLAMSIAIIFMDIAVLVLQYLNLFMVQTAFKVFFYSVKLKVELGVLSRLVSFVHYQPDPSL